MYQQADPVANAGSVMLMSATENLRETPMRRHLWLAVTALPLLLPAAARADEVTDAMKEAMRAYEAGKFTAARSAMSEAMQLLSQRTAASLGAALPAALPGWKAADAESNTAALGFLGGGSIASRRYSNGQGQHVEIKVTADSPIISQLGMIMTNPIMAGAMGKLIRVGDQRAIQTSDNEIEMLVDNRILVTVNGDAPDDAKLAYAKAIDLAKLSGGQ